MKTRKVSAGEKGSGRDRVRIGGKLHHRDVSEKMGADGIIETHVNHTPVEKNYYGKPKDRFCGSCGSWVIKNYEYKGHGKACK